MLIKTISAILVIVFFAIISRLVNRFTQRLGLEKSLSKVRVQYTVKITQLSLFFLCLVVLILVIGWDYPQVFVFLSSIFAVIGVAMFAQWSMLSNLTASLMIFFGFPYRVGDLVRVVDKDDDISGRIEEIGPFHVLIRRRNQDLVTYPNSLILQKPVIKIATGNDERLIKLVDDPEDMPDAVKKPDAVKRPAAAKPKPAGNFDDS